jgi:folate-dependent phosphoribosylglycinamide formyltransferase PurN
LYQLGWFSTGRGPGSRGLLTAVYNSIQSGEIDARLGFVFCSRELGEAEGSDQFIKLVQIYHIPLVCFSYRKFRRKVITSPGSRQGVFPAWRLDYDRGIMTRLQDFQPDLCILAGYMLIVGREMCQRYDMINLHPAAPDGPKGTWQEVIWQLLEQQAEETGAMMHLVTPELDRGPVVTYCTFPIRGGQFGEHWAEIAEKPLEEVKQQQGEDNALFRLIRAEGVARELPLIIATVRAFSEGRVKITAGDIFDAQGRPVRGYDLSDEIDRMVGSSR